MYTIVMSDDKQLVKTQETTIFQRESSVDKIQFLIPQKYDKTDLTDCMCVLKYVDQGNVAHAVVLDKDKKLYKKRIRYFLSVDTELTQFAGDITIRLTFLKVDADTGVHEIVLHSGETTITITALSDYFQFVSDDSLEVIDQKLLELQAMVEATSELADSIDTSKADNLVVENNKLSLTANGDKIGDEVDIVTPRINDGEADGVYNGVLDLDKIIQDVLDDDVEDEDASDDEEPVLNPEADDDNDDNS